MGVVIRPQGSDIVFGFFYATGAIVKPVSVKRHGYDG
jgi:hypothetical protein